MELLQYLKEVSADVISEAQTTVLRAQAPHYVEAGSDTIRARVQALYDHVLESLERRDLGPIVTHAKAVAERRYASGFDLGEVQVAFNALEEVVWRRVLQNFAPAEFAEAIGLISTVLGAGKDVLARTYVSLATRSHAPSLDLRALLAGTSA